MKSWRYLSKHLEVSGRKLILDISGPIQGKQIKKDFLSCSGVQKFSDIFKENIAKILIINTKFKNLLDVYSKIKVISSAKYLKMYGSVYLS